MWCSRDSLGTLTIYTLQLYLSVVLLLILLPVDGKKTEPLHTAAKCLSEGGNVVVECGKPNQKILVKSVSYAHASDCNNPQGVDECVQASVSLAHGAQAACNGRLSCTVPVMSISVFNAEQVNTKGLEAEEIFANLDTCNVNGYLQNNVEMNTFQVKFECEEFSFCKEISSEVEDLAIATENWPAKVVTNPTCECTFGSADEDTYHLVGYAHCNGTVMFVTEEHYMDGTTAILDYKCTDKFEADFMSLATNEPYKIKVSVDVDRSDEESAYEISWFNVKAGSNHRKFEQIIKVDCDAGKLYLKASVQLILKIVVPICSILLIALIVIYCVCSKRRRKAKDWRARHVRLPPRAKQAGLGEMVEMGSTTSRSSSMDSFSHKKHKRVDPEGNVDDIGELAAMMHKQNEERRRQELEKRQGYKQQQSRGYIPPVPPAPAPAPARTPPPVRASIQPSRRTQSIGNLRSNRQYTYADNLDTTPYSKPLAYSKSASQSRASVRSLKRRAPQPAGPPQVPVPTDTNPRPARLSSASSTPSVHRIRARNASQPALYAQPTVTQPAHPRGPPQYASPYATSASVLSSPGYSEADANNSDEDMPIMRPSSRTKPPIKPKPSLPPKQNPRYPPAKPNRSITPGELGELQQELENSD